MKHYIFYKFDILYLKIVYNFQVLNTESNKCLTAAVIKGTVQTVHMAPVCCHFIMPLLPEINRFQSLETS